VLLGRNKVWTIIKNYPWPHLLIYLPLILFFDLSAVLYALLWRRDASALRGRIAALRRLPYFLRKRRAVQSLRVIPAREMFARMRPVESPLCVLRRYQHLQRFRVNVE